MFLQGRVNSSRYITQVVNAVLLPFLRQEGDVLFQQDNARLHTAAATQRALRGVQQLPWPERSPDLSPIEHVWDMMKRELTPFFFSRASHNHCRIATMGANCLGQCIAG